MARIEELRAEMAGRGIDFFTADTSDAHGSEYICEHDNALKYISGFTGSNARLAVTKDEALLWTDGRYFIQAEAELKDSGIRLMKMGEEGVPGFEDWLRRNDLQRIPMDEAIVDAIWQDRPRRPAGRIFIHRESMAGEPAEAKLLRVRAGMKKRGLRRITVRRLDDIAWVLDLRGSDIPCNPVFYAYLCIGRKIKVFLQPESVTEDVREHLNRLGVKICDYDSFRPGQDYSDMISYLKTRKTETEVQRIRESCVRDGVYMTRFICWLKSQIRTGTGIDEIDASDKLESLRREDSRFVSLSFPTISAYGSNAAIVHYEADDRSRRRLEPKGFYLVDSGAQYYDGTTDVTRTVALGELTAEERMHYTLVCMGMLRTMHAQFVSGASSHDIDVIARGPLREHGLDYNHGTGHGIGYFGCVHEGPARISRTEDKAYRLRGGEIISDEPGVYIAGAHGVRIENMLHVKDGSFENLTWVPLERSALDLSLMTDTDRRYFDEYQNAVYEKISPYLNEEERNWLRSEI